MTLPIGMVRKQRNARTDVQNIVSNIMLSRIEAIWTWLLSLGITEENMNEYVIDHEGEAPNMKLVVKKDGEVLWSKEF
jgi:hypothetical protein